jgi:hypothetical protein
VIACVTFAEVEAELHRLGFHRFGQTRTHYAYRSNGDFVFVKMPNVHGYLPESVVKKHSMRRNCSFPTGMSSGVTSARVATHGKAG